MIILRLLAKTKPHYATGNEAFLCSVRYQIYLFIFNG